ncbi:transcription elongation factor GreA [Patescibacteria group bacterium]
MNKPTYLTKEGLEKVETELNELINVKRKAIAQRIQDAKELGDLSENAEYAEAKTEQSFTEGRIAELESIIKSAQIIEHDKLNRTVVEVGNTLVVKNSNGVTAEYVIVGSNEADPSTGRISNESPLGRALLGKKVGEAAEIKAPNGTNYFEVISIN